MAIGQLGKFRFLGVRGGKGGGGHRKRKEGGVRGRKGEEEVGGEGKEEGGEGGLGEGGGRR